MTPEELHKLALYNTETGLFSWLEREGKKGWNTRWAGKPAGNINVRGYVQIQILNKNYLAHRLAWFYVMGEWPEHEIDHIDLNRSNNAWSNLRHATRSENAANSPPHKDGASGYKGVSYFKGGKKIKKWVANIKSNGKKYHLGYYMTKEEAAAAYAKAAAELHGEFARIA
jgi:hypothetical protein